MAKDFADLHLMGLVGTREAAKRLNLTTVRVGAMIRAGQLRAQRIGRDWLIDEKDLEAFAKRPRPPGRPRKKK